VRYGEKSGVPTPVSRLLTDTLLGMVRGEIPIAEFSRQPDKLIWDVDQLMIAQLRSVMIRLLIVKNQNGSLLKGK